MYATLWKRFSAYWDFYSPRAIVVLFGPNSLCSLCGAIPEAVVRGFRPRCSSRRDSNLIRALRDRWSRSYLLDATKARLYFSSMDLSTKHGYELYNPLRQHRLLSIGSQVQFSCVSSPRLSCHLQQDIAMLGASQVSCSNKSPYRRWHGREIWWLH